MSSGMIRAKSQRVIDLFPALRPLAQTPCAACGGMCGQDGTVCTIGPQPERGLPDIIAYCSITCAGSAGVWPWNQSAAADVVAPEARDAGVLDVSSPNSARLAAMSVAPLFGRGASASHNQGTT